MAQPGPTSSTPPSKPPSYRALLEVPQLGRLIGSMQLARIAQSMVGVSLVLFALDEYGSPALAGLVTLTSILPGLLLSPVAGALLDRQGRVKLMILDYLVSLTGLLLIGVLALLDLLPAPLLIVLTIITSITGLLSVAGLRSIFPMLVPKHLWERVNAVDSNGYVIATILGPPIAATLVALVGPAETIVVIAIPFGLAAMPLIGFRDPTTINRAGSLLGDAWQGLSYVWRNPTLRGLGFSVSVANLAGGMTTIVIPLLVVRQLGYSPAVVGLVFAAAGVSGLISTFFFGRFDTRGREWVMLVVPFAVWAPVVTLLLPPAGTFGPIDPVVGLALIVLSQLLHGLISGPLDIALFTVRQRRTDPAMLGRAFAVSMAFNFVGYPIGSALAGILATASLTAAILLGVVASALAAVLAAVMIPRRASVVPASIVGQRPGAETEPTAS